MTKAKRSRQSSGLGDVLPSLFDDRAGTEEADNLEHYVTLAFVVEDGLNDDSLPRYDTDCVDNEPG
eukprot:CAMPEP_0178679528 /NCGR_PEP_ID=MMETSP0699-20121125/230_1 /TAXON_ID=265572 /ORGANISM="Extubocellulus spinifer, Strain CCMP396" /LENGTH=65 /DNA_ID=CAMNT_0020323885 /DNA_START=188 /DNA_END=385 /DNA_ORIENTATION=+